MTTMAEADMSDPLDAMVNALHDSLSQDDILNTVSGSQLSEAAGSSQDTITVSSTTSALLSGDRAQQLSPAASHSTSAAGTVSAATSMAAPASNSSSSSSLSGADSKASPQHMPIQMMMINGREQPALLMTIEQAHVWQREQKQRAEDLFHQGSGELAVQMEQQQKHMQQLLETAKPDTVFAIPVSAAAPHTQGAASTAQGSVSTTMTSVSAERPPTSAASAPTGNSLQASVTPTMPRSPVSPNSELNLTPLATASAFSTTAVAAAAQASAVAAHLSPTGRMPLDSLSEPARKRKKKAAVDALPKPLTPYQCFFREIQVEVRRHNPKASFVELSKTVNSMWEGMPEASREVYNTQAKQSLQEYEQAVKAIQGTSPTQTNGAALATQFYGSETDAPAKATGRGRTGKKNTKCLNEECMNQPLVTGHRGGLYCSDKCAVTHCQIAFKNWVAERRKMIAS